MHRHIRTLQQPCAVSTIREFGLSFTLQGRSPCDATHLSAAQHWRRCCSRWPPASVTGRQQLTAHRSQLQRRPRGRRPLSSRPSSGWQGHPSGLFTQHSSPCCSGALASSTEGGYSACCGQLSLPGRFDHRRTQLYNAMAPAARTRPCCIYCLSVDSGTRAHVHASQADRRLRASDRALASVVPAVTAQDITMEAVHGVFSSGRRLLQDTCQPPLLSGSEQAERTVRD